MFKWQSGKPQRKNHPLFERRIHFALERIGSESRDGALKALASLQDIAARVCYCLRYP